MPRAEFEEKEYEFAFHLNLPQAVEDFVRYFLRARFLRRLSDTM
jgi:hypothetical protein